MPGNRERGGATGPDGKRGRGIGHPPARFRFLLLAHVYRAERTRRRHSYRPGASRHADALGGYGQLQAAARRHAAGWLAAAEMADRQSGGASRARKVGAAGMPRTASENAPQNDREDDRRELQRAIQNGAVS